MCLYYTILSIHELFI